MIKAAAGGGGRGIRIAIDHDELDRVVPQASLEAKAAFGDGGLYLEKVIESARHIEVQVLGDGHDVVHCFERECSLQRRRQKLWEEGPAVKSRNRGARTPLCGRGEACPCGVVSRCRHARIPLSTRPSGILFHRNEYAHPGRAPGDRVHHRHRPRARDDQDRGRGATALSSVRHRCERSCHRMSHQRRGSGEGLPAVSGGRRSACIFRAGPASVSTACSMPAMRCRLSMTRCSAS